VPGRRWARAPLASRATTSSKLDVTGWRVPAERLSTRSLRIASGSKGTRVGLGRNTSAGSRYPFSLPSSLASPDVGRFVTLPL
jgi:hypothetical protein